ncbi:MAG TPA: nuclear transport factor 2 family protein [Pyrinomonadaceae bacterium]|nr:nuclear transport factor 2 family protein [Pyrinomonadaceae bacterium]
MKKGEQEIRKLDDELVAAVLRRDTAFMNDIWAEDASVITPFGDLVGKDKIIRFDEKLVNESIVTDEINVRVYDRTAVVTGRATIKSRYEDLDLSGQYRFTRIYLKQEENWRIVAYQATRIGQE